MQTRRLFRTSAAALAIGVMVLGIPVGSVLAVEKQEFQDECEAGGGTFAEGADNLSCDHKITVGPDKGKKIRVTCSKHSNACVSTVIDAQKPGRGVPPTGAGQQITGSSELAPLPGGMPRRP
ncbi:MAG: hypothetical protein AB7P40_01090 [Chloroflexota bacterium]